MMNPLIKPLHGYFFMIISTEFMVHVLILSNILTTAKRDSWVSMLLSIFPVLVIRLAFLTQ